MAQSLVLTDEEQALIKLLIVTYPLSEVRVWAIVGVFCGMNYTFDEIHSFVEMAGKANAQGMRVL